MPIKSTGENYDRPERLEWLLEMLEKHNDRQNHSFDSLNQKATWTLATATGLGAASGFVKGTTIGALVNTLVSGQAASLTESNILALVFAAAFFVAYLLLLYFVIRVYNPKIVEYPVSINTELGPVKSRLEDKGEYGTKCWDDLMERYVLPSDIECYHKVLRGYVDTQITTYLMNHKMGNDLKYAFYLLFPIAVSSFAILLFA